MAKPKKHPDCPLCGHDGPKETAKRRMSFPIDLEEPVLTLFKCPECQTIFTPDPRPDPFAALEATC